MTTPFGLWELNRMPFGLTSAPAMFQRLMVRCLAGLNLKIYLVYLDDVIVFGSTYEETLKWLEIVLKHLGDFGLKLKAPKCKLFHMELSYLGHVVSALGVSPDPDKIKAKMRPSSRLFLALLGTIGHLWRGSHRPLSHFTSLLPSSQRNNSQRHQFQWTPPCQATFETIISKLTSPPVLAYPDFSLNFTLHTDESGEGLGAVLYQVQDGRTQVIAYGSRTLDDAERK